MPSVTFPVEDVPPPVGFEPVEELPEFPVFPEVEPPEELLFPELPPVELSDELWLSEELSALDEISGKLLIMLLQILSEELSLVECSLDECSPEELSPEELSG